MERPSGRIGCWGQLRGYHTPSERENAPFRKRNRGTKFRCRRMKKFVARRTQVRSVAKKSKGNAGARGDSSYGSRDLCRGAGREEDNVLSSAIFRDARADQSG